MGGGGYWRFGRGGLGSQGGGAARDPLLPHAYLQGGCVSGCVSAYNDRPLGGGGGTLVRTWALAAHLEVHQLLGVALCRQNTRHAHVEDHRLSFEDSHCSQRQLHKPGQVRSWAGLTGRGTDGGAGSCPRYRDAGQAHDTRRRHMAEACAGSGYRHKGCVCCRRAYKMGPQVYQRTVCQEPSPLHSSRCRGLTRWNPPPAKAMRGKGR